MAGKLLTGLRILLSWLAYAISFLVPRDPTVWVFIGWHKNTEREVFADNAKYLFLHVAHSQKNIRAIWIAQDEQMQEILRLHGYESYSVHSLRGTYYALRAGYTIIDANMQLHNWRLSGGSRTVQLWHADGIKSLDLSAAWRWRKIKEIVVSPGLFKRFHFLISSSRYIAQHFICPSFDVPEKRVRITGLPRYDSFFLRIPGAEIDLHTALEKNLREVRSKNPGRILFYAPTFRRGERASSPLSQFDLTRLNGFLARRNDFLFVSLHPKFSTTEWLPKETFTNVFFVNSDFDKYPLLPQFDLVITDYSSLCLEFLLLDKPAIFFVYDFEEYRKDPGIPEDFWNLVPGPRVKEFEELLDALTEHPDVRRTERAAARDTLFTFTPGTASANVTRALLDDMSA